MRRKKQYHDDYYHLLQTFFYRHHQYASEQKLRKFESENRDTSSSHWLSFDVVSLVIVLYVPEAGD